MKSLQDFATYAEYSEYRWNLRAEEAGTTQIELSDGTTTEVIGSDFDIAELERAHSRELTRLNPEEDAPTPENGWYYTDEVQY
jgi:hypothetical protein